MPKRAKLIGDAETKRIVEAMLKQSVADKNFTTWIVVVEVTKLQERHKLVFIRIQSKNRLEYEVSFVTSIEPTDEKWLQLPANHIDRFICTFSSRNESLFEAIGGFIKRTIKEGKMQDFLK